MCHHQRLTKLKAMTYYVPLYFQFVRVSGRSAGHVALIRIRLMAFSG